MREETKKPAQTGKYFAQSGRSATKYIFAGFRSSVSIFWKSLHLVCLKSNPAVICRKMLLPLLFGPKAGLDPFGQNCLFLKPREFQSRPEASFGRGQHSQ